MTALLALVLLLAPAFGLRHSPPRAIPLPTPDHRPCAWLNNCR
jgi:hypothetical protein